MRSRLVVRIETRRRRQSLRNPEGSQSRPGDLSTGAAVPGRSAALQVCVASPNAAAARGDAAQAAF